MEVFARRLKVEQGSTMPVAPSSHQLLFGFNFGSAAEADLPAMAPSIGLEPVDGAAPFEAWWYRGAVEYQRRGGVAVAVCEDFVAAVHQVNDDRTADIRNAARQVYDELLEVVDEFGPLTIVRAWNYFSRINQGRGDEERYRQFSVGRAESFEARGLADMQSPPGTAIGSASGSPFTVVLLASRHPCKLVENPRQMSAFEYPPDYGPRSPRFSRGGVLSLPCGGLFLISGTAAIVGHSSCRTEGIEGQAVETFRNLESLLRSAGLEPDLSALDAVRVYLRDGADRDAVRPLVEARFGRDTDVTYLKGDICRAELDLEIDGVVFA